MQTEPRPKPRPKADRAFIPPRGIRFFDRPGKPQPFFVEWHPVRGGPARTLSFARIEEREAAGRKLAEEREEHGAVALSWNAEGWREYLDAKAAAEGADLRIVVHEWRAGRATSAAPTNAHSMSVADAVEKYLRLRLAEDITADSDTHRHLKLHLVKRFAGAFAGRRLHEVTADDLRGWMNSLKNPDSGEPMSNLTKRHHRKDVNTFLKRAVMEEWIAGNVCARVKAPSFDEEAEDATGRVISPEDLAKLFRMNREQPVIGRMALEVFGGLRASSAERMQREHVDYEGKGLSMPGALHKSGKRKHRTGHPEALWAWLRHAGEAAWTEVTEGNYGRLKSEAFIRAGVDNPGNGLRHSFVSYHLALFKNMPLTSYLAQHRKTTTTEGYEGLATEAAARKWAAILP